ncbi:MAG: alpha/beta fold hydrolase [Rubrivivax sp.]|nr:alpha/beta fold hydrolase [Rubrivivax sp.]
MRLARLLQALTLLGLAALLGLLLLWWRGQLSGGWPLLMLLALLLHVPAMALEFVLQRLVNRGDPAPPAPVGDLLRAWRAEALGALNIFGWQLPWRWRRFADHLPADAPGRRGLVLVHGFVCNRGLWNAWWPTLRARGVPCIALNLEPVFGSIDRYAPRVEAAVQRMTQATGRPPLLVGHSMGGLALRAWMRSFDGEPRAHGVVTVGTPHHGTWLARFGLSPNTHEMRLGSAWLAALAAQEPAARYRRFTCFYGHCDNIVFPTSSATLPGADNRHLAGHAHIHLLRHPEVLRTVLQRLDEDDAPQPAANCRSPGSTAPASICGSPRTSA